VKNEEHCILHMLSSVHKYIDEVVLVDTGSTDSTVPITALFCSAHGMPLRVYNVGFTNFGEIRTITAHLACEDWVLMLDADEALENPENLSYYTSRGEVEAWALPRKRWLDLYMMEQTELDAYPDPQVRLFRNNVDYKWKRELHEYFDGAAVEDILAAELPPICIHHFHDVFKSPEDLEKRHKLYSKLASEAGVTLEGGKSIE